MIQKQWSQPLFLLMLAALLSTAWACESKAPTPEDKAPQAKSDPSQGNSDQAGAEEPCEGDCDKGDTATESGAKPLVVYSGRAETLVAPVLKDFEADTGIKLQVRYGDNRELAQALAEEGDKANADVFFSQDASTLGYLADKELFTELPFDITRQVKIDYRDPRNRWIGTSGRSRVLVYNMERVLPDAIPKAVEDLAEPTWKGRVGWTPQDRSFQSFVATMIQLKGSDQTQSWLEGMHKNEPKAYPGDGEAVRAVASGDVDAVLVEHDALFRVKEELGGAAPIANHYFRNGQAESLVHMAGVGLVKTSQQPAKAQKLIQYLLARKAQEHFANKAREFPVSADLKPTEELPALDELKLPVMDMAQIHNLGMSQMLLEKASAKP